MSGPELAVRKPRLLLDVDGVTCDFIAGCETALQRLGYAHHIADLSRDRDLFKVLPELVGRHLRSAIHAPGFCADLPVMPHAIEAVRVLESVADVYIVTSPWWSSPHWIHERLGWLKRHLNIERSRVVFTEAKHLVLGDHFVDDHDRHVDAWRAAHPNGTAHRWPTAAQPTANDWKRLLDAVQVAR